MSIMERTGSNGVRSTILECIADDRRRRILSALVERSSPLGLDDLADRLAASEYADPSETDVAGVRAAIEHGSVPALAAAGLVEWDRDAGTVTAADHPALSDPTVRHLLDGAGDDWGAVVDGVADECRSTVLTILAGRTDPTPREALAREVARRRAPDEPSQRDVEDALVALHHVHLPKLDDAGLVAYDHEAETVTYRGHPELEPEWFGTLSDCASSIGQCSAD